MVLHCGNCNAKVKGENMGDYENRDCHDWMDAAKYTFCRCPECHLPMLAIQELEYIAGDMDWGVPKQLYPGDLFSINPVIPEGLKKALQECIQCYRAGSFSAAVIMCRRTIEGFCSVKGIKENNLDKSIKKLKETGIINDQLFEWANELRIAGNDAAHNINVEFTSMDARDTLDFTIAILDFTYSFKEKFEKFKARKKSNGE